MLNLLVADDNPISLDFLATAVRTLGWNCVTAVDGAAAAEAADRTAFDLILLDACMPVLDGPGALAMIRSGTGASRSTPALATTATGDSGRHAELIAAGFAGVLTKPTTIATLAAEIERHARPGAGGTGPDLDDDRALAAADGDAQIVTALRGLLVGELERLPGEIALLRHQPDSVHGLAARLHRLQASAGFCGADGLERAARALERLARTQADWPTSQVASLLALCETVATCLRSRQQE